MSARSFPWPGRAPLRLPCTALPVETGGIDFNSIATEPCGRQSHRFRSCPAPNLRHGERFFRFVWSQNWGAVVFSPQGNILAVAFRDKALLFDVPTFHLAHTLRGHDAPLTSIAFSSDGKRIVTSSEDATARVWDTAGNVLAVLTGHTLRINNAEFSSDGKFVVSASDDGTARTWRLFPSIEALIDEAKRAAPRCLTISQREHVFIDAEPPAWCIEMEKWPYQTAEWNQWLVDTRAGKSPSLPSAR